MTSSHTQRLARAAFLAIILSLSLTQVARAQTTVRVSVKFVLDSGGSRPTSGSFYQDSQINTAIADANSALTNMGAGWQLELTEIVDVNGISQWFGPMSCNDKGLMENAAEANQGLYQWRTNAVNIYIVNDLIECGGVCSFPQYDHDIIIIQSVGGILGGGVGWLHELGHYFNLYHTFECFSGNCNTSVCTGAGGQGQACPDSCPQTTNVMSYNFVTPANATLSACQLGLVAAEMAGRRSAVVSAQPSTAAAVTSPSNNATLSGASTTFQWDAGSNVTQYALWVGTASATNNLYNEYEGSNQSATVTGLPTDGSTLYVRLFSQINGSWQYNDYTYTADTVVTSAAAMTSPTNGATLAASSETFQWNAGGGVSQYALWVGTASATNDLYNEYEGSNQSAMVTGLPTNGSTVYVRLWSQINGSWQYNDSTYTAVTVASNGAAMTSPTNGATLSNGSSQTFSWNTGTGVSQYALWVGTSAGANDLYNAYENMGQSRTVTGLPTDGSTLYVRLWSQISSTWSYNDYTYTADTIASSAAAITSPSNGATLAAASQQFQWNTGTGVSQYALWVGTKSGTNDLYNAYEGSNQSQTVTGLPTDGSTVHVRLWSQINGDWEYADTSYTAATVASNAAAVTSPTNGATLSNGSSQTFSWNAGTGVTQYALWVGTAAATNNLYNAYESTNQSSTVTGLPTDGSTIHVRLWSQISGAWQYNDYSYTADTAMATAATLTAPSAKNALSGETETFTWNAGSGVTQYALWVGRSAGTNDLYNEYEGSNQSATVSGLPIDGSQIHVRLWSQINGSWQYNDESYTCATINPVAATMVSPLDNSTLGGSSVTFQWTLGAGASQYALWVGTSAATNDLYNAYEGNNLSRTVNNLPTDGSTIYVRVWTQVNGVWLFVDYTYTAASV